MHVSTVQLSFLIVYVICALNCSVCSYYQAYLAMHCAKHHGKMIRAIPSKTSIGGTALHSQKTVAVINVLLY